MSPIASGVGIAVGLGSPPSGGGGASYPANQILALDANNVSGTTWTDLTGNGNDFTLVGSPAFSALGGGCLEFEGTNVYAEITSGLGKFDHDIYTVSIWFYYSGLETYQGLWSYDYTSHTTPYYGQHMRVDGTTGKIQWNRNGSSFAGGGFPTVAVGSWHQLVLVCKEWSVNSARREYRMFHNGVFTGVLRPDELPPLFYDQEVWIARINPDNSSNIKVATVKFFTAGFSDAEVLAEFDDTKARFGL